MIFLYAFCWTKRKDEALHNTQPLRKGHNERTNMPKRMNAKQRAWYYAQPEMAIARGGSARDVRTMLSDLGEAGHIGRNAESEMLSLDDICPPEERIPWDECPS